MNLSVQIKRWQWCRKQMERVRRWRETCHMTWRLDQTMLWMVKCIQLWKIHWQFPGTVSLVTILHFKCKNPNYLGFFFFARVPATSLQIFELSLSVLVFFFSPHWKAFTVICYHHCKWLQLDKDAEIFKWHLRYRKWADSLKLELHYLNECMDVKVI